MIWQNAANTLFLLEAAACLLPVVAMMGASVFAYIVMLFALPGLLLHPQRAGLYAFALITAMVGGGLLGLLAIAMAFHPEGLRRNPRRKALAFAFAGAGVSAEWLYVYSEGVRNVFSHPFSVWMLSGPVVFGVHLLYRLNNPARTAATTER